MRRIFMFLIEKLPKHPSGVADEPLGKSPMESTKFPGLQCFLLLLVSRCSRHIATILLHSVLPSDALRSLANPSELCNLFLSIHPSTTTSSSWCLRILLPSIMLLVLCSFLFHHFFSLSGQSVPAYVLPPMFRVSINCPDTHRLVTRRVSINCPDTYRLVTRAVHYICRILLQH